MQVALVIQSNGVPEELPIFNSFKLSTHIPNRDNGLVYIESPFIKEIYLPQRDKNIFIYSKGNNHIDYESVMKKWDVGSGTQMDKLKGLVNLVDSPLAFDAKGEHGSISIVTNKKLYCTGIITNVSIYLTITETDIIPRLRHIYPNRYFFFRLKDVDNRIFLNTQAICSKWWRWNKVFSNNTLSCFNALELMLKID